MSEKFHKEVAAFKKENGNASFTPKEMMMYVVSKVDKIDDKLEVLTGRIVANTTAIKYIKIAVGGMFACVLFMLKQMFL